MKKSYAAVLFLAVALLCFSLLTGCGDPAGNEGEEVPNGENNAPIEENGEESEGNGVEEPVEEVTAPEETEEPEEYRIYFGEKSLALFEWDDEIDLKGLLGEPLKEKTVQLDSSADTFAGSYLKYLEYDGIALTLFSPAEDGSSFWVYQVEITGSGYATARGIEVGDRLEEVQEAYPKLEAVDTGPTGPELYRLVDYEQLYTYVEFEIQEDTVENIHVYHELP